MTAQPASTPDGALVDLEPEADDFLGLVVEGLSKPEKTLPTQFLYDERGSHLFDQICDLDEYYPTRTELMIMSQCADEITSVIGSNAMLIEYGSGSGLKTKQLLGSLSSPRAYIPVEISREHLLNSAREISDEFSDLEVLPVCADFTKPFDLPAPRERPDRRVIYFPGSTIGNFKPPHANALMREMARHAGRNGGVLLGVDLRKDRTMLERAYNDREGVTAAFNLNLLARINRELRGDFDLESFRHRAIFNEKAGRIEMRLESTRSQSVRVGTRRFDFYRGESICTEYSYKYSLAGFETLVHEAHLKVERVWTDPAQLFSVQYLTPRFES